MKLYISILLSCFCFCVQAQETDTTTIRCLCNNQTVYIRFGYKPNTDTTKTFTFNKDSLIARKWGMYVLGEKGKENGWQRIVNGSDTSYTKTFKYIPATAVGFIAHGSTLERFTNPFRFPYSDMMPDDPESTIYMRRLCTKILNAQIHKP